MSALGGGSFSRGAFSCQHRTVAKDGPAGKAEARGEAQGAETVRCRALGLPARSDTRQAAAATAGLSRGSNEQQMAGSVDQGAGTPTHGSQKKGSSRSASLRRCRLHVGAPPPLLPPLPPPLPLAVR